MKTLTIDYNNILSSIRDRLSELNPVLKNDLSKDKIMQAIESPLSKWTISNGIIHLQLSGSDLSKGLNDEIYEVSVSLFE